MYHMLRIVDLDW